MTISSETRRAGPFVGSGSTGPFPFAFKVFEASDMLVVKVNTSTNVESTLTLTTDFTVSLNADQNANPGGSITLTSALASGYNMVISSKLEYIQETDLTNQGGFYPEVITDALDKLTIQTQQLNEEMGRTAKLPITSAADADALVADIVRIADSADNIDTVATNIDDVNDVADSIDNVDTVADDISNVNTVASAITNVNTVAGDIADVSTVADDIADVSTVAGSISNVNIAAASIADISTVADDLNEPTSEIETVATNITNVNTVGTNIANVNTVAGVSTNVTTVAGIAANVTTVAGISSDVSTVAGISSDVQAVENIAANVTTVAGVDDDVSTVAGMASNVTTGAGISSDVTAVAAIDDDVSAVAADATDIGTVAADIANINTVATNIASVNTAAGDIAEIIVVANDLNEAVSEIAVVADNITSVQTVGDNIADVNTVATDIADVNTVAADSTAINAVAGNATNINTVAGIDSDVTTVAGIASDVTTVATNVADITNFSDVYQGPKSTPPTTRNDSSALQLGDLYFNTVSNAMFVYASTGWVPAGSSVNGTSRRFRYIATSGQTTFTGSDSNGNTMAYDAGFVDVYLNGVRLDQTDYTATSGDSIVLGSAAALNDELNIVAFGTFSVADINGVDIIDGTVSANKLASGAAVSNIGYTPVNKAGDTMTGELGINVSNNSTTSIVGEQISNTSFTTDSRAGVLFRNADTWGAAIWSRRTGSYEGELHLGTKPNSSGSISADGIISRVKIDGDGRVTMPYQPAFSATGSSGTNSTINNPTAIPLASTHFNRGNHYNTSTSKFTAPVSGVYQFNISAYLNSDIATLVFLVNDAQIGGPDVDLLQYKGSASPYTMNMTAAISLSAGDAVSVSTRIGFTSTIYIGHTTFSGFLVG